MKNILLLFSLFLSFISLSQDLSKKLAEQSNYLFTINGGVITEQVSKEEISSSEVFHEMMDEFFRGHAKVENLDELGIDYNQRIYFSAEQGNDVQFSLMTYHIKDISAFERLVNSSEYNPTFETKNGLNYLSYDEQSKLVWNKSYALLITVYYNGQEYNDWGYNGYFYDDYFYEEYEYAEEVAVEVEEVPLEEMTEEEWNAYMKEKDEERERKRKEREEKRKKKEQEKAERKEKREAIEQEELNKRITQFFSDELLNSKKYLPLELDEEAAATFWYPNYISFLDPFFYGVGYYYYRPYPFYGGLFGMTNFFNGEIVVNGYLEENQLRMDAKMNYFGDLEDTYANIFSQKIDKSYANFLSESDLGFMSLSVNTEEILNEYPNLIENMMSMYDTSFTEEYKLFAELFTIAVDEKAIAELFTGDALIIMNGLGMKEVTKYVYEYDEEYNYERVLKTQMELLPDFSFISGSNRPDIIEKFVKLGLKHELLESIKDGYKFIDKHNDFPLPVYFTYTDEHFIFTSDADKMSSYKSQEKGDASKDQKNLLLKNNGAFHLNAKDLVGKILMSEEVRRSERRIFTAMESEISTIDAYMKYEKGGNHIVATAPVPESEENGAKYLLHFFNKMILAEKRR
ncbi:MAG: hypothetical protein ABJG68_01690 [Crocinitomicaceae bacterium]